VLLLQGKSEKLLDMHARRARRGARPHRRSGTLQKLHGKVDDKRRSLKSELEGIANQLSGIKEVSEEE